MSNTKLGAILLGVAVLIVAGFIAYKSFIEKPIQPKPSVDIKLEDAVSTVEQQPQTKQNDLQGSAKLTVIEVNKHNTESNCWTIINGKVYDITKYVPRHPGGDEILRACGSDGTTLFTQRKTTSGEEVGSGSPHSNSAESQLAQFYLGDLQQ